MSPSGWLFLGTCITAAASLAGVGFTIWQARQAQKAVHRVEDAKTDVERDRFGVESLRGVIDELSEQLGRMQGWHAECEERCADCMKAKTELRIENKRMCTRIEALEQTVRILESHLEGGASE